MSEEIEEIVVSAERIYTTGGGSAGFRWVVQSYTPVGGDTISGGGSISDYMFTANTTVVIKVNADTPEVTATDLTLKQLNVLLHILGNAFENGEFSEILKHYSDQGNNLIIAMVDPGHPDLNKDPARPLAGFAKFDEDYKGRASKGKPIFIYIANDMSLEQTADTFIHEMLHPYVVESDISGLEEHYVKSLTEEAMGDIFTPDYFTSPQSEDIDSGTYNGAGGDDNLSGKSGSNELNGYYGSDILNGGGGNDILNGGYGNDTYNYNFGQGNDIIFDSSGSDKIVITGNISKYSLEFSFSANGADLLVSASGASSYLVVKDWVDNANRIETIQASDGTLTADYINTLLDFQDHSDPGAPGGPIIFPIVLDMDGDGIELLSPDASSVKIDVDGDGVKDRLGWVGANDALLAIDRNGDGKVNGLDEISFVNDAPGARTDLEGLAGFDSNKDGALDALDDRFGDFLVWRDENQNGKSEKSELLTLAQAGISSINLTPTTTGNTTDGATDNVILNTTEFIREDGSTGAVGDVAFVYRSGTHRRDHQNHGPRGNSGLSEKGGYIDERLEGDYFAVDATDKRNPGSINVMNAAALIQAMASFNPSAGIEISERKAAPQFNSAILAAATGFDLT